MKLLVTFSLCITLNIGLIYSQQADSINVHNWEQKAKNFYDTFKYDSAANYFTMSAKGYNQQKDWLNTVKNYRLAAKSLNLAFIPDSALTIIQIAIELSQKHILGNTKHENYEQVENLIEQGVIYEKLSSYEEGLQSYQSALTMITRDDSISKLKKAKIWNNKGYIYYRLNKYDKGLEYYTKSLEAYQELLGNNHIDLIAPLLNLGLLYQVKGLYDKALEYYNRSLNIAIQSHEEYHPKVAKTYNSIGVLYRYKGNYDKALEYLTKSLEQTNHIFGKNHPNVGTNYMNIGAIYLFKGDYSKAQKYYQESLTIRLLVLEKNHPDLAKSYISLGLAYFYMGDYIKALEYYHKALDISANEKNNIALICYTNMAAAYRNIYNYEKASEYNEKALKLSISIYGENHPNVANNYTNIGVIYNFRKDYDKALESYNKALQIRIQTNGEKHHTVAKLYTNIGIIYSHKKDYENALKYFQKTLEIRKHIYGSYHPYLADAYNKMTLISDAEKDFKSTLNYYQEALMANLIDFNDSNIYNNPNHFNALSAPELYRTLRGKAQAFFRLYKNESDAMIDLRASLLTYDLASNLIHKIRTDYSHENSQLLLSKTKKYMYEEAMEVALELYKKDANNDNLEKAFEFIEKSKSATLSIYLNDLKIKQYWNVSDSLQQKEKDITQNRRKFETKIQRLKAQRDGYDTLLAQNYQDRLLNYSIQYDSLINVIKNDYPDYFNLKYKQEVAQIADIQKKLDKNSVLINYFVGDTNLFISLVTNKNHTIKTIKTDSLFNEKVMNYYLDIKSDFAEKELKNSTYLYNYLIEPLEEYLEGKNNLVVVPDGSLYYVPFETLCKKDIYTKDLTKLNFLIKDYSISYHHTATLWLNSKEKEQNQIATENNFIGFAPVFDPKINNGFIVSSDWIADTTGIESATRSVSNDFTYLNPLEFSESEVKSIVQLYHNQKKEAKGFFHKEASEENFKKNIEKYKLIHIASHSFTNDLYPNLSGIAFSQPDTNKMNDLNDEDGILYAGETYNLNLSNANLLVLSSCKSGLGKLILGEGFLSLSRGFLYSGVPNIVFSLWDVQDEQTKDLMIQFYKNILDGKSYTEALRKAKLALIKNPKTASPKYWGAWLLVGS